MKFAPCAIMSVWLLAALPPMAHCQDKSSSPRNNHDPGSEASGNGPADNKQAANSLFDDNIVVKGANYTELLEGIDGLSTFLDKKPIRADKGLSTLAGQVHLLDEIEELATRTEQLNTMIAHFEEGKDHPEQLKLSVAKVKAGLGKAQDLAAQVLVDIAHSMPTEREGRHLKKGQEYGYTTDMAELNSAGIPAAADPEGLTEKRDEAMLLSVNKNNTKKNQRFISQKILQDNPRLRQHFQLHEALATGDFSAIHQRVDRLHCRMTGNGVTEARRLQADDNWKESCTKLVNCVRDYTLYDTIAYFWGPYVNDDGEIDDNFAEADGLPDVWTIVNRIRPTLNRFHPMPEYTQGFQGLCSDLLERFHRNQRFDNFTQYHPATWREVCRTEGSTCRYIIFNEIRDKLDTRAADQVFDDMARCAHTLGEDLFFSSTSAPRVPTRQAQLGNGIGRDRYGKAIVPAKAANYFEMEMGKWSCSDYHPHRF